MGVPNGLDPVSGTIQVYDRIASEYAATWFGDPVMEPILERFLSRLPEPWDILDAGCGPGRDVLAMARRGTPAVGIDLSSTMIAEARARVPGKVFRRMDLRRLSYPPESFRGIWACASLQHLPADGAERALGEFARVLVPGGILAVIVEEGRGERLDPLGRFTRLYEPPQLRELIVKAGFRILEEEQDRAEKSTFGGWRPRTWLRVFAARAHGPWTSSPENEAPCIFCPAARFELNRELSIPGAEAILWGDQRFWVIPDIAPLVEGHLLLITLPHHSCFGDWPEALAPELLATQHLVRDFLSETYGEPVLFLEHGATRPQGAGSCIDHAHWHCLPTALPIREAVESRLGPGRPATLEDLRHLARAGQSYFYLEEAPDRGRVYPGDDLPSQFLRQVVTSLQGRDAWRWQKAAVLDDVRHTRRRLLDRLLPLVDERMLQGIEDHG